MPSIISAGTTTGTALSLTSDTSGELQIQTNNGATTAMTIASSGKALIGTTTALTAITSGKLQVVASDSTASVNVIRTSSNPPYLSFGSGSSGDNVVDNGQIGIINWTGFHTAAYSSAAQIAAEVDGTPGATSDMQQTTGNIHQKTCTTCTRQRAPDNVHQTTCNRQRAPDNMQHTAGSQCRDRRSCKTAIERNQGCDHMVRRHVILS
jgi:hypothetical protein